MKILAILLVCLDVEISFGFSGHRSFRNFGSRHANFNPRHESEHRRNFWDPNKNGPSNHHTDWTHNIPSRWGRERRQNQWNLNHVEEPRQPWSNSQFFRPSWPHDRPHWQNHHHIGSPHRGEPRFNSPPPRSEISSHRLPPWGDSDPHFDKPSWPGSNMLPHRPYFPPGDPPEMDPPHRHRFPPWRAFRPPSLSMSLPEPLPGSFVEPPMPTINFQLPPPTRRILFVSR